MKFCKKHSVFASLFLLGGNVCANVIFPSMVIASGVYAVFGWSIITISVIIEFLVLYFLFDQRFTRALLATIVMNAASGLFSTVFLLLNDLVYELLINGLFHRLLFDHIILKEILLVIGFYIGSVVINSLIETTVGFLFFGTARLKKLFIVILIANAITVAIGLIGLGLYMKMYGFPHIRY